MLPLPARLRNQRTRGRTKTRGAPAPSARTAAKTKARKARMNAKTCQSQAGPMSLAQMTIHEKQKMPHSIMMEGSSDWRRTVVGGSGEGRTSGCNVAERHSIIFGGAGSSDRRQK